jgi:hypothetical protein
MKETLESTLLSCFKLIELNKKLEAVKLYQKYHGYISLISAFNSLEKHYYEYSGKRILNVEKTYTK